MEINDRLVEETMMTRHLMTAVTTMAAIILVVLLDAGEVAGHPGDEDTLTIQVQVRMEVIINETAVNRRKVQTNG